MRTLPLSLPLLVAAACASAPELPEASDNPAPDPVARAPEGDSDAPQYKPSSSSPAPVDITTNAYGAYGAAPDAPKIGDVARDFKLPLADGGTFDLAHARKAGPVLVMFYRGFW